MGIERNEAAQNAREFKYISGQYPWQRNSRLRWSITNAHGVATTEQETMEMIDEIDRLQVIERKARKACDVKLQTTADMTALLNELAKPIERIKR